MGQLHHNTVDNKDTVYGTVMLGHSRWDEYTGTQ